MNTYLDPELASGKFDDTAIPTDIADLMSAAADHVRQLQRGTMLDIGLALLPVKDRIGDRRFGPWVEHDCKTPVWLAHHAINVAELSIAAGLLASAAPAAKSVSIEVVERPKVQRQRKPGQPLERTAPSPWVVKREPPSDRRHGRHQQEPR